LKTLNSLYWLKKEKKQIENQIKELTVLSAVSMSGMPSGAGVTSPVERFNERLEQLKEKLQKKCDEILAETERIEGVIESITDPDVRVIARERFINNKGFQAIGDELFIDRTTAYKKLKRYFERKEENEQCNGTEM